MADSTPEVYAAFVSTLLDAEARRRTALEQKGGAIIATAGTLSTLLFGLVAVVTSRDSFALPGASHGWLEAAIVLFVIACFLGILISVPLPYGETTVTAQNLKSWWNQQSSLALLAVSAARLQGLAAARRMNTVKAVILDLATGSLVAALVMLAVAVIQILNAS
ncbi:MAG: hypothetical protein QOG69_1269 [Actinomycetota bacterium]|jgi:hypothetical protein|nr:hypothetical protein [Actinomycetota bacterium]